MRFTDLRATYTKQPAKYSFLKTEVEAIYSSQEGGVHNQIGFDMDGPAEISVEIRRSNLV